MNQRRPGRVRIALLSVAAVSMWATSASAETMWLDFDEDERMAPSIGFSNGGLSVTATGFNTQEIRLVAQGSWGLGVTAPNDASLQVDGSPHAETLRLVFSEQVEILALDLALIEGYGDDFSLAFDGQMMMDDVSTGNGWWELPADYASLGASTVDLVADHSNDDFTLRGIRIATRDRAPVSGVPEPSAALVFAAGTLLVARSVRRVRRRA